jgi:hypothetical protein
MKTIIYCYFGLLLLYHCLRFPSAWKRKFSAPPQDSELNEILKKAKEDADFQQLAIATSARFAQLVSALTVIALYFFLKWSVSWEKIVALIFGIIELSNIVVSEHIVVLGLKFPGKVKPRWVIYFSRFRSLAALGSIFSFGVRLILSI